MVHCNILQHTATHCNTLQHTATHCNTLQHTATHCNTLQHSATHCNTVQHSASHCTTLQHTAKIRHPNRFCHPAIPASWSGRDKHHVLFSSQTGTKKLSHGQGCYICVPATHMCTLQHAVTLAFKITNRDNARAKMLQMCPGCRIVCGKSQTTLTLLKLRCGAVCVAVWCSVVQCGAVWCSVV